jgi:hypothetical protein
MLENILPTHTHIIKLKGQKYNAVVQETTIDDNTIKIVEKYIMYYKKGSAILRLHKGSFSNFWTIIADDDRKSTFNYDEIEVVKYVKGLKLFHAKFWITFSRNGREYNNLIEQDFKGKDEEAVKSYCNIKYANFGARIMNDIIITEVCDLTK